MNKTDNFENEIKQLKQEVEFYKLIADNTYDWEVFRDETGRIKYISQAFERITGYQCDDILSGRYSEKDLIHPDDVERVLKNNKIAIIDKKEIADLKFRIVRIDGNIRYVNLCSIPVFVKDKFIGTRTSVRDISQQEDFIRLKQINDALQKQNEEYSCLNEEYKTSIEELQRSQEMTVKNEIKFKSLFNSMQEGVYLHKMIYDDNDKPIDYIIIEANPISEKFLNINADFAIGKKATELFNTDEAPYIEIYNEVAISGVSKSFTEYFAPMNKWFHISVFSPNKGEFATVFLDITELKTNEMKLIELIEKNDENQSQLKTLIDTIPDLVWLKDADGVYLRCNKRFEDFFGAKESVIIGKTDYDFLKEEAAKFFRDKDKKAISVGGPSINEEEIIFASDGHKEILETIKTPVYDSQNKLIGVLGIGRDITERKKSENELQHAKEEAEKSNKLKTAFLQNLSHEIRTPLNAICGFSEMLNEPDITRTKISSFTKIIRNSSNQLLSIIDDILTISSLETNQEKVSIEKVDLNELFLELYAIFSEYSKKQNISLYNNIYKSKFNLIVETDKTKITQILTNLLSNAFKFTNQGYIEFGCELQQINDSDCLKFYVKDTGIGIDITELENIFERFRQADKGIGKIYGGTGLGLSISKGFVELLGGKIWVESEKEQGSTFYFTIPFVPLDNSIPLKDESISVRKKLNVLIAEDEDMNYLYLEEILKDMDINIYHAKNGLEAYQMYKELKSVDLILMDIKMPVMDGFTATDKIREINNNVPIIAQSAYAQNSDIEKFEQIFDGFVIKPINKLNLKELIEKFR